MRWRTPASFVFWKYVLITRADCFGSSCCKMNIGPISLVPPEIAWWIKICLHVAAVNTPLIFSNYPTTLEDMHTQTSIEPPSCLIVGFKQSELCKFQVFFGLSHTFFDSIQIRNFDSPVQSTFNHCSIVQFLCSYAYFSLLVLFLVLVLVLLAF